MTQESIDRRLKWGIIFSLIWMAGIGSAIAVILGIKAKNNINNSNENLYGKGKAWFCIIVGGIGLALWIPVIVIGIYNQF